MKNKIYILISSLVFLNGHLISQCISDQITLLDEIEKIESLNIENDTLMFKLFLYKLSCEEDLDYDDYNELVDTLMNLEKKFRYSGSDSEYYKFLSRNRNDIKSLKRFIFKHGYEMSIRMKDYLLASEYADKLSYGYIGAKEVRQRRHWKDVELRSFEKYAKDNYLELIEYHKFWLFSDTIRTSFPKNGFAGENHLVEIISKKYSKSEFKLFLEEAINSSQIKEKRVNGRPFYFLQFELKDKVFGYLNEDISKRYMRDTILKDTFVVYDCFGQNSSYDEIIKIKNDTIVNQIENRTEMTLYKAKFRRTRLFQIANRLKK